MADNDCPSRDQVVENLKALPRECATWPTLTKAVLGRVGTRDEVVDRLVELLGWRPVGIQAGDSWEQLEQDAGKTSCTYFGRESNCVCSGCDHDAGYCLDDQRRDIVLRAKKLAVFNVLVASVTDKWKEKR